MTPLPIEDPESISTSEDALVQPVAEPLDAIEGWITRTCVDYPPAEEEKKADEEEDSDDDERRVDGEDQDKRENNEEDETALSAGGQDDVPSSEPDDHRKFHAVLIDPDNLWDNGETITYSFIGPSPLCGTPKQHNKVTKVLKNMRSTWKDFANLKFKHLPQEQVSDAIIRIQFKEGTASWAEFGKRNLEIAKDKPTMNLGWIGDDDHLTDIDRGVILHEFGHVLGLLHEHQSPLMGGLITIKPQAVKEVFKTTGWSQKQVDEQVLQQYQESELTNYSEFDSKSIMMYFMPAKMNNEGIEVPPNDALSKFDKAFVANALRLLGIAPDQDEDDHAYGGGLLSMDYETTKLTEEETAKATEERQKKLRDKERIMKLYRMGDWMGIRKAVKDIYKDVREDRMKAVRLRLQALSIAGK